MSKSAAVTNCNVFKDNVQLIAQTVNIPYLADDVANSLAIDVEYRMREIIQEALKFAKHSKREVLTPSDINSALSSSNVEMLYGFNSLSQFKFSRVPGTKDMFYMQDRELEFSEIMESPLPV